LPAGSSMFFDEKRQKLKLKNQMDFCDA